MITEAQSLRFSVHVIYTRTALKPVLLYKILMIFYSFWRSVCGAEEQKKTCERRDERKEEQRTKQLRRAEKRGFERI